MKKKNKTPIFQEIETSQLVKASWNYRDNDDQKLAALCENIRRNGMIETLAVRKLETGAFEILNGNHRYDALQQLHVEKVWVCNLGDEISDAKARRIAVELNETRFPVDKIRLGSILRDISEEFDIEDMMATLPFSRKELDKLLALDDMPSSNQNHPPGDTDTITIKICLDQEQFEAWLIWKKEAGTDNDTLALCRAVEGAILHRQANHESK
jgi:ParB-like chromosome segregation protein Spo0J